MGPAAHCELQNESAAILTVSEVFWQIKEPLLLQHADKALHFPRREKDRTFSHALFRFQIIEFLHGLPA